eukprot:COSAG01_NODE_1694_length_9467_cov_4.976196_1_plen_47_part_10
MAGGPDGRGRSTRSAAEIGSRVICVCIFIFILYHVVHYWAAAAHCKR